MRASAGNVASPLPLSEIPGARNLHAQPMLCDDISIDYPDLVVILAHGGRPLWMNEAFFLVRRHKNMHMDISGIPPQKLMEYFPRIEDVADKVLWGTDWPGPGVAYDDRGLLRPGQRPCEQERRQAGA